jgi:hypothetical protein
MVRHCDDCDQAVAASPLGEGGVKDQSPHRYADLTCRLLSVTFEVDWAPSATYLLYMSASLLPLVVVAQSILEAFQASGLVHSFLGRLPSNAS